MQGAMIAGPEQKQILKGWNGGLFQRGLAGLPRERICTVTFPQAAGALSPRNQNWELLLALSMRAGVAAKAGLWGGVGGGVHVVKRGPSLLPCLHCHFVLRVQQASSGWLGSLTGICRLLCMPEPSCTGALSCAFTWTTNILKSWACSRESIHMESPHRPGSLTLILQPGVIRAPQGGHLSPVTACMPVSLRLGRYPLPCGGDSGSQTALWVPFRELHHPPWQRQVCPEVQPRAR